MIKRRDFIASGVQLLTPSFAGPANAMDRKPAFVLVHGTWHGGWVWHQVKSLLQNAGHRVITPTCTGCGEREHLSRPDVGLETHISDILNAIRFAELDELVLVGHSFSGHTITGVADRIKDRIRHIVYFDALVPRKGVMAVVNRNPDTGEYPANWEKKRKHFLDGYKMRFWDDYPIEMLLPSNEKRHIARLQRLLTTHPVKQWTDELTLENGGWEGLTRSYIHCSGQAYSKSSQFMWEPARSSGWQFLDLPIPRNGMMSHPKLVAETLIALLDRPSV